MSTVVPIPPEGRRDAAAWEAALTYVSEAFALAALDGVHPDALAEAALCAAMCELVAAHGETGAPRSPPASPTGCPPANSPTRRGIRDAI